MVATLISMNARMAFNDIMRKKWKIALYVILALHAAPGLIAIFAAGHFVPMGFSPLHYISAALIGCVVILLMWIIVPIFGFGLDSGIDPRRLSPILSPTPHLATALLVASMLGLPGIITTVVLLAPTVFFISTGQWMFALATVFLAPAGTYGYVLVAKVCSSALATTVGASRGRRETMMTLSTIAFLMIVTPAGLYLNAIVQQANAEALTNIAQILAWVPILGAPSIPLLASAGMWGQLAVQVATTAAIFVGGTTLWKRMLTPMMIGRSNTISVDAERALSEGRHLIDDTVVDTSSMPVNGDHNTTGMTAVNLWTSLPIPTPVAAIAARTLNACLRDPRVSTSFASTLIFPCMIVAMRLMPVDSDTAMTLSFSQTLLLAVMPMMLAQMYSYLTSYDSTALWMHIVAGVSGRDDRLGRFLGPAPLTLVIAVVSITLVSFFGGSVFGGPLALTAMFIAIFGITFGVTSVFSAYVLTPVQPPGASPLATKGTGNQMVTLLSAFGTWIAVGIVATPLAVAVSMSSGSVWHWVWLAVAVIVGIVVGIVGFVIGARAVDRRMPEMLATIRSWPDH